MNVKPKLPGGISLSRELLYYVSCS